MNDEDDDTDKGTTAVRYPCMPSLVALQQMRTRLHIAFLGKKLMNWTAQATRRELRKLAGSINEAYMTYTENVRNCYILLARARYFYPDLNKMVVGNMPKLACISVQYSTKSIAGVKILKFHMMDNGLDPYPFLGIGQGGTAIYDAKQCWRKLCRKMIYICQKRVDFLLIEKAQRNANKREMVLKRVVMPRLHETLIYINLGLEEIEREDKFRLKMIQKYQRKRKAKKEQTEMCTEANPIIDPCCVTESIKPASKTLVCPSVSVQEPPICPSVGSKKEAAPSPAPCPSVCSKKGGAPSPAPCPSVCSKKGGAPSPAPCPSVCSKKGAAPAPAPCPSVSDKKSPRPSATSISCPVCGGKSGSSAPCPVCGKKEAAAAPAPCPSVCGKKKTAPAPAPCPSVCGKKESAPAPAPCPSVCGKKEPAPAPAPCPSVCGKKEPAKSAPPPAPCSTCGKKSPRPSTASISCPVCGEKSGSPPAPCPVCGKKEPAAPSAPCSTCGKKAAKPAPSPAPCSTCGKKSAKPARSPGPCSTCGKKSPRPSAASICPACAKKEPVSVQPSCLCPEIKLQTLIFGLTEVVLLSKLFLERGVECVNIVEFLKLCEDIKKKIETIMKDKQMEADDSGLITGEMEELKYSLKYVIEHGKCPMVKQMAAISDLTEPTFDKLERLNSQLSEVIITTQECNRLNPSPSTEDFLEMCNHVKSKLQIYSGMTKADVKKIVGLKKQIQELEEMIEEEEMEKEVNSSNMMDPCCVSKISSAEVCPATKTKQRLANKIKETVKICMQAKSAGITASSVDTLMRTNEQFKNEMSGLSMSKSNKSVKIDNNVVCCKQHGTAESPCKGTATQEPCTSGLSLDELAGKVAAHILSSDNSCTKVKIKKKVSEKCCQTSGKNSSTSCFSSGGSCDCGGPSRQSSKSRASGSTTKSPSATSKCNCGGSCYSLSPPDYEKYIAEIVSLGNIVDEKLKKFCDTCTNPKSNTNMKNYHVNQNKRSLSNTENIIDNYENIKKITKIVRIEKTNGIVQEKIETITISVDSSNENLPDASPSGCCRDFSIGQCLLPDTGRTIVRSAASTSESEYCIRQKPSSIIRNCASYTQN